jgi:hypothetical protein
LVNFIEHALNVKCVVEAILYEELVMVLGKGLKGESVGLGVLVHFLEGLLDNVAKFVRVEVEDVRHA